MLTLEYEQSWTVAERLYLSDHFKSGAMGKASATSASKYTLLEAVIGKGQRLVIGDEIEHIPSLDGRPGYRLTEEGVTVNMVADAFKLLPKESETMCRWNTVEWAKERKGWVFLTSKATMRKRILPLVSLWLDLLLLRFMNEESTKRETWFLLDELASLQRRTACALSGSTRIQE